MFGYVKTFFSKLIFGTLEGLLGEVSLKLLFIIGNDLLKMNLIITLTSTIKSNFTLSYQNKNQSLKFIFDILKPNKNNSVKSNSFKSNSFKRSHFKSNFSKS